MKIIIGIDGPRDLDLIEEYTGLEGGDKHHDQRKRLREAKKTESKNSKKHEQSIKKELKELKKHEQRIKKEQEMQQPKFMKPLHVICMHLDKKPEVIYGVLMQLYVLQGFDFNSADRFTRSLLENSEDKEYDKYDAVVNILNSYLKNISEMIDKIDKTDNYPDYIKDRQELIILHSKINGGVAHNRNMIIHYISKNTQDFSEYTHIHFLDYSGQLGRPFFDVLSPYSPALKQSENKDYGVIPSPDILSNNGHTQIPHATDDMYIGNVRVIKSGERIYEKNRVAINSSTGMSLWPKYIPMSDIKKGFSFINADMNEDLFMLQQINRVPRDDNYKHVDSLHYYNGLGEHPNPIHIKDLNMAMENIENIENNNSYLALEAISKLWTQCYLRIKDDDFEHISSKINALIPELNKNEEYITDMKTIIDKLITKAEPTDNVIDAGASKQIRLSTEKGRRHNEHPCIQLNNGYYYIHLTKRVTQGTANVKPSNIIMKLLEENELMKLLEENELTNYSFKDLYISPIPIKSTAPKKKYVFIPLYSYLEYMHPTNSYIIEYTINKLEIKTTELMSADDAELMSADVFGDVINDEKGIRSGWIKEKGKDYGLLERSPVRISIDGTIHINPLFITDASEPGYVEYLQFICDFNSSKHKLPDDNEETMASESDLSDVKEGDKINDKFKYYTIKHDDIEYELAIYKNKSIHYDDAKSYHDFPEAFHAKIFGGKIGLGLTIILLILVLITVLIIVIIKDGNNQKRLYDPHLRYDI